MARKIILNLAISLDGYIADEDGGYDWTAEDGDTNFNTEKTFDFTEFMDDVDKVVMGRKAYRDCSIKEYKTSSSHIKTTDIIYTENRIISNGGFFVRYLY